MQSMKGKTYLMRLFQDDTQSMFRGFFDLRAVLSDLLLLNFIFGLHGGEEKHLLDPHLVGEQHDASVDTYITKVVPRPHPPVGGSACSKALMNPSS